MRLAPEVQLRPVTLDAPARRREDAESREPRSLVLVNDRPIGDPIPGCRLEAAIECRPGWLLFVTDDVPFEEMLRVLLIGRDGQLIDSATVGGPYATGSFSGLRLEPPSRVHFRFIDDADWAVDIFDRSRAAVPWWPDAKGVWRGSQLSRHFAIRRG